MDSYITDVRVKEFKVEKKKVEKPKLEVPKDVDLYEEEPKRQRKSFFSWFLRTPSEQIEEYNLSEEDFSDVDDMTESEAVDEYEALGEVEEEIVERRESLFTRLFRRRQRISEDSFDDGVDVYDKHQDSEEVSILKEDLKTLGILSYDLIKKLNEEEFKRFKLSEDFAKYKEILKKYNLIRVKY
ncbi:hypothetical protein C0585_05445 [Candidatus Woesearchaeota archaeon]|nr:MAG: hypothetical protein C0585_05445 [Candidatus Woesearchaeota archaeon]